MLRRLYVRVIQSLAPLLRYSGLDRFLARRRSFWIRHLWSLFAIYDVERMALLGKPWWVYRAADEVERFLTERDGDVRVFEYGAGSSTVWLATRAREVHSVEHDADFVAKVEPMLAGFDNVELHHVAPTQRQSGSTAVSGHHGDESYDFEDYADSIKHVGGVFDLIVIDGRARVACLQRAVEQLATDGLLVFDNAGRERYADGLARCGLDVEPMKGLAPSLPLPDVTALLRHA